MSRWVWLGALWLAAASAGCAAVGVEFEPEVDFSSYRTWAWLPRLESPPSPFAEREQELALEIERHTEQALSERGFVPVPEGEHPDFFVTYHLELFIEVVEVQETPAEQYVDSLNDSPSYGVTRMELRRRVYERGHLVIDVADGVDRQLVWRGQVESKYRGSWKPHAGGAVDDILDHFPPDATTEKAASLERTELGVSVGLAARP